MTGLDNLTAKILSDAKLRADEIIAQGRAQAAALIAERTSQADSAAKQIILDAKKQARESTERMALQYALKIRDDKLRAKQQTLDRVFALALKQLSDTPKEEFYEFLLGSLAVLDTDGERLTVPAKYNMTDLDELNALLKARGKKGNLVPEPEPRDIGSGFILAKDGIEQNNTFDVLLKYHRHRLEGAVIKELF